MRKIIVVLLAGVVSITAANAGEEKSDAAAIDAKIEASFAAADLDKNGSVTREEFDANYAAKAQEAAANGEIWDDAHKEKALVDFTTMAGEDGSVTLEEAKAFVVAKQEAAAAAAESQGS